MIDGQLLNHIASAFAITLDGAYAALHVYSLGLLGTLALMYFTYTMAQGMVGFMTVGEALGTMLWIVLKIGVFYFLLVVLYDLMWNAAFRTFLQWGIEASGGTASYDDFLNPGTILVNGFKAAYPMKSWADKFIGPMLPFYVVDVSLYMVAYWLTVLSFAGMALALLVALIEMKLAIATGGVLIPWGVLTQTSFIGELSIAWLVAGLVRILVTAVMVGIAKPLFELLALPLPTLFGPDPTAFQSISLAVGALFFAVLAWVVPNRAAGIGGRGMALALTGESFVAGGFMGYRYATQLTGGAIRGVSRLPPST
jgi:type IV secretion system protein TrbL